MNAAVNHRWQFASMPRDRAVFAEGVVILMYHKVARPPVASGMPSLYVSPGCFRRQMAQLDRAALPCIAFGEAAPAAQDGRRAVCVTFDDGFRNVFEAALPVLAARRWPAIQFIVAGAIGKDDAWDRASGEPPQRLMDDREISDWLGAGMEIGSHTLSHPLLARLPPAAARAEIFDSKKLLEDRFGRRIDYFCYPYGNTDERVRDLVAEAGYLSACTVEPGANKPGADPHALRRVLAVEGGFPPDLPALAARSLRTLLRRRARLSRS